MSVDEIIKAIENTTKGEISGVVIATIEKYRKEYPDWKILFLSVETDASDPGSRELRALICKANEIVTR